jgi:NAD+ diphosphatase
MQDSGSFGDRVYIFQGANLILPGDVPDSRGVYGVDRKKAEAAFGSALFTSPAYYEVPGTEGLSAIPCLLLPPAEKAPPRWQALAIRHGISLAGGSGDEAGHALGRLFRAYHILLWRQESAFCGSCGSRNGDSPSELARLCPACGRLEYPRISPAIIVIIINEQGEALLAHNKKFNPGVYSLIAGFNEAGENLEATVTREIREEVSLEVRDIRYIASQPWPFPNSLMLGFSARYARGTIQPDGEEILDAQWFPRDRLPELPGKGSVSRYLINRWVEGKL